MAVEPTITEQERALLTLIAKGESAGVRGDPYTAVWAGTTVPTLTSMTLDQVDVDMGRRITTNGGSASGRYQFIRSTFREVVGQSGLPGNTRFSPQVQDFLILVRLKNFRGLDRWKAGTYSNDYSPNNDLAFQVSLAREFASIPVPFALRGAKKFVNKGQSFYAGDGLNKAGENADVFLKELITIRAGGPGEAEQLLIEAGSAVPVNTGGNSEWSQAQIAAGGGQTVYGGGPYNRNATRSAALPSSGNPYQYEEIDPLDNRYDFRTGKKVYELWQNSTSSAASFGLQQGNGRPPPNDVGRTGFSEEERDTIVNKNTEPPTPNPHADTAPKPVTKNPDAPTPNPHADLPKGKVDKTTDPATDALPEEYSRRLQGTAPATNPIPEDVEENIQFTENDYEVVAVFSGGQGPGGTATLSTARLRNVSTGQTTSIIQKDDTLTLQGTQFTVNNVDTFNKTVSVTSAGGTSFTFDYQSITVE